MQILVRGGAGYIGSATVDSLVRHGYKVVVADNLSKGSPELIHPNAQFHKVDITDKRSLAEIFGSYNFDAVMHFAAYKSVAESMRNPEKYQANVTGTNNLLELIKENGVRKLIFSSTAAVYGNPMYVPIDEQHPTSPINTYGSTKLACEKEIEERCREAGIEHISLRFFNVVGDAGKGYIDPNAENIVPKIMEVLFGKRNNFTIFGSDYKTKDGTAVRDYVDVNDIVRAHILDLDANYNGSINLGTANGTSVLELINMSQMVFGMKIPYEVSPRREGNPDIVVASNKLAMKVLEWEPTRPLEDSIKTTFEAYNGRLGNRASLIPVFAVQ